MRSSDERQSFEFLKSNPRPPKPRSNSLTEIRGPYYSHISVTVLSELLDALGPSIDSFKFAGGSFVLFPPTILKKMIDICHRHSVEVSTGGFIEHVLTQGESAVDRYIDECQSFGFDIVEVSSGFITLPLDDWLRIIARVEKKGMKAKPEIGIQFGAGGSSSSQELRAEGKGPMEWALVRAKRFVDAGARVLMVESEGVSENVGNWQMDFPVRLAQSVGLERLMFEAADPAVFSWYVKNFGPDVNLFVDHSQIIQLECLRRGLWGTQSLWGRVCTYRTAS